jgi:hypothetical protein
VEPTHSSRRENIVYYSVKKERWLSIWPRIADVLKSGLRKERELNTVEITFI